MSPRASALRTVALCLTMFSAAPLFAVSKDMVQLETQIQQLQDSVARLQQANDERMGALQNLVQQTADQTTKINAATDAMQRQLQTQVEAGGGKIDQVSGQVQALNDSLDEIKTRLGRLEKLMQDVRAQQQAIPPAAEPAATPAPQQAAPDTAPQATAAPAPDGFSNATAQPVGRSRKPSAGTPADAAGADAGTAATTSAVPVDQLYKTALGDYMSARYGVASSEFSDLIRDYPTSPLAGNAAYYQGEIDYRGARYAAAVRNYDQLLEQFPDSNKVPAAHLHKGQALLQLKQNDAAIREFRLLAQRFTNSPEALQAKTRLAGLGITTARPR